MRRYQKEQCRKTLSVFREAHTELTKQVRAGRGKEAAVLLEQCQQGAIDLGTTIEQLEGEGTKPVRLLEDYCEALYRYHAQLSGEEGGGEELYPGNREKLLDRCLIRIGNSIRNDLPTRYEALFLPYKAAMWDSLESIYRAAAADPDCDAYCVPIPYFDKNPDGSFRTAHYEGGLFPKDIPVTPYDAYDMEGRHPEMIFIHNPYDKYNYVSSVHPHYYSDRLRECTERLIYVPYYATAGSMDESQAYLPSYLRADYIVVQSAKLIGYYDAAIPRGKFLPLGSPKFDRVIAKCKNPPAPPKEWEEMLAGKKVFFYNTSIGGFLGDTAAFLKKMAYVFDAFRGRRDACLIWRPHPLLESTMDSMRAEARPVYDRLKRFFIDEGVGIYDETPDIENTIALSDAYIGDTGTSVTSLFGVAGKPLFILDNQIDRPPAEDDWKGSVFRALRDDGNNRFCVTQGNKLWFSEKNDGHYRYFCDLSHYTGGNYYIGALEAGGKVYVLPGNAEQLLAVEQNRAVRKLPLKHALDQQGAFCGFYLYQDRLMLVPNRYPAFVHFDAADETVRYLPEAREHLIGEVGRERVICGSCLLEDRLLLINPEGTELLSVNMETLAQERIPVSVHMTAIGMQQDTAYPNVLWFFPYRGTELVRWDVESDSYERIDAAVPGLYAIHRPKKYQCDLRVFANAAYTRDDLILAPAWGNRFVRLHRKTGKAEAWRPPVELMEKEANPYFLNWSAGYFYCDKNSGAQYFFDGAHNRTWRVNLETNRWTETEVTFDRMDVLRNAAGFGEESQWLPYCLRENAFHSLTAFIDDPVDGTGFDREVQLRAFSSVNASPDGNCGEETYRRVKESLGQGEA